MSDELDDVDDSQERPDDDDLGDIDQVAAGAVVDDEAEEAEDDEEEDEEDDEPLDPPSPSFHWRFSAPPQTTSSRAELSSPPPRISTQSITPPISSQNYSRHPRPTQLLTQSFSMPNDSVANPDDSDEDETSLRLNSNCNSSLSPQAHPPIIDFDLLSSAFNNSSENITPPLTDLRAMNLSRSSHPESHNYSNRSSPQPINPAPRWDHTPPSASPSLSSGSVENMPGLDHAKTEAIAPSPPQPQPGDMDMDMDESTLIELDGMMDMYEHSDQGETLGTTDGSQMEKHSDVQEEPSTLAGIKRARQSSSSPEHKRTVVARTAQRSGSSRVESVRSQASQNPPTMDEPALFPDTKQIEGSRDRDLNSPALASAHRLNHKVDHLAKFVRIQYKSATLDEGSRPTARKVHGNKRGPAPQ